MEGVESQWEALKTAAARLQIIAIGAAPEVLQKLPALVRGFFADPHLRYITAATA